MREVHIVILAAGQGTRMKSSCPKVLTKLLGTPVIDYIISSSLQVSPNSITVITKYEASRVEKHISEQFQDINFVRQSDKEGTGAAVQSYVEHFKDKISDDATLLILGGDAPLITPSIISNLLGKHKAGDKLVSLATTNLPDPNGYGRIIRDPSGPIQSIVEQKDATQSELEINEVNCSVYAYNFGFLKNAIANIDTNNASGEFYLTDTIIQAKNKVGSYIEPFYMLLKSFNDRYELSIIENFLLQGAVSRLQKDGVTITNPNYIYIEPTVIVEEDVTILEGCRLIGDTVIRSGSIIGPNTILQDTLIDENATVESSKVIGAKIGKNANIGPFSYIRPETEVGEKSKVGAFVEVKKSNIGNGSKVPHLSYIGDTKIGENTNLGAGTVTANYDGKNKHKTTIGSDVKIGSDTVIVAPVNIGDKVYSGAGSVIRKDVEDNTLVYSENTQHNKKNYKKGE